ncbi:MAG: choice-of-anchor L domain-containing protein, partial [Bacteroidota bacterium]
MKKNLYAFVFFCFAFIGSYNAQLIVSDTLTAQELADLIDGPGVTILDPQITCPDGAYGSFEANGIGNFDPESGVILATGFIDNAIGPNNTESKSTSFPPQGDGDPDLQILSQFATDDACKFEFDIIPDGDSLRFEFTFASEEYSEYACTNFNDVFGFFISGPGIVGDPGLGDKKNIALIPGTTEPVTINTVNGGNPTTNPPCAATNPEFFQANPLNPLADIQYDGWTRNLFALASGLQPCEKYHLELIIADASDQLWDSGVFIEEIVSNNIAVSTSTVGGVDFMIEGCNPGSVLFERDNAFVGDIDVTYFLQGTATNGVDYDPIGNTDPLVPNIITIPAGQNSVSVDINPIEDFITEGEEYIDIYVGNPACASTILDSVRFFIRDSLTVEVSGETLVCAGDTVELSATGDAVEWDWGPSTQDFIPNDTQPNVETVVTEDVTVFASGKVATCITTVPFDIEVNTIDITANVTDSICLGDDSGEIDITVIDSGGGLIYSWSGPGGFSSGNEDLTGLIAGEYCVDVEDADGCTATACFTINSYSDLEIHLTPVEYMGGVNISCNAGSDGQIFAIASEGIQPYTYQWNDPAMTTGEVLSGVPAGTYTVLALDSAGCGVTDSITLIEPDPIVLTVDESNSLCFGDQTGIANANVSGGIAPYSFFWYNSAGQLIDTDETAENIAAGDYSVAVRDANLCSDSITFSVQGPDDPIQIQVLSQTNVSCAGFSDGAVSLIATGGTVNGPGDYIWDPGQNLTGLSAGEHTISVTDLNGCTEFFPVVITEPEALVMTLEAQENITCLGEECGSATVFVDGGTPPYDFLWPDGAVTINNVELCAPGTYTPTVTDSLGCTASLDIEITAVAPELTATFDITNIVCGGDTTGAIDMTIVGGTAPFNVLWASDDACDQGPFNGMEDLTEVCAGEWCVFITDANGCSFDTCVVVGENDPLTYEFEVNDADCFGAFTGDIDLTVMGGTGPGSYTFEWYGFAFPPAEVDTSGLPLETTEDLNDYPGGVYVVQVTDGNGCEFDREITLPAPDDLMIDTIAISNYNGFEISCPNSCDGFIDIDVTGGTTSGPGQYTYEWKEQVLNYEVEGVGPGFQDQAGLCASEDAVGYEVIVVDDNFCIQNAFFVLEEPPAMQIDLAADSVSCSGLTDGGATATVGGGVGNFMFEWYLNDTTGTPVATGNPLTGVGEGMYYVVVSDDNACLAVDSIEIATPNELTVDLFAAEFPGGFNILGCNGEETGFIAAAVDGGTPEYFIDWTDPSGATINTTDMQIENLPAGSDYCLTITDQMNCMTTACIPLTEPFPLTVDADISDITCFGEDNGIIDLTITGGVDPVVYWGDTLLMDSLTLQTGLEHGIYYVTVVDSSGCQETFEYTIIEPEVLKTTLEPTLIEGGFNIECNGDMDAEIVTTTTGGTGAYTYDWEHLPAMPPASDPADLTGLGPGTYILHTFDDNDCVDSDTITLSEPPPIVLDFFVNDSISCFGECDGQIGVNASGGTMGFISYLWDFGFNGPITPDTLCVGTYSVTVTDLNDCIASGSFDLDGPDPLIASVTPNNANCAGADDGSFDLTILGGTPGFNIYWILGGDTISTQEDPSGLAPGTYCLSIADANGCTFDDCYDITEPDGVVIDETISEFDGFNVSCGTECDGSISLSLSGGTPMYTCDWAHIPGNDNPCDLTMLCAGTYTVTVTDANNCSITETYTLISPSDLTVMLESPIYPGGTNISCVGDSTGAIFGTISGGATLDTIFWTFNGMDYPQGADLEDIGGLLAGTYEINVVDVNGCTVTETISLDEPTVPLTADVMPFIYPSGDNISCFGLCDGSFTTNISGGSPGYEIEYRDANGDIIDPMNLCAGIYTIIVLDTNECFVTLEDTLFQPEPLELDSVVYGENFCSYDTLVSAVVDITGGSPGFSIDWTHIVGTNDPDSVTGLEPGTYPVIVT